MTQPSSQQPPPLSAQLERALKRLGPSPEDMSPAEAEILWALERGHQCALAIERTASLLRKKVMDGILRSQILRELQLPPEPPAPVDLPVAADRTTED